MRFLRCRLVVIFDVQLDATTNAIQSFELVHLIGQRFLITAHPAGSNVIPLASQQIEDSIETFGFSVSTLTFSILNALVDRYDAVITQIQAQVTQLRQRILDQHESEGVEDVYRLTKLLGDLRQVMSPEEALISSMHSPDSDTESDELTDAFRDVSVDLQSAIDTIDQSSALVSGLLDTYETLKSDALNMLVKRLTVLSIMLALIGPDPVAFRYQPQRLTLPERLSGLPHLCHPDGVARLGDLGCRQAYRLARIAARSQSNMFATAVNASAMLPSASPSLTRPMVV